jgi:hypothetical protein
VKSPGARAGFRAPNVSPIGERESSNSRGSRRRTSHEQVLKGSGYGTTRGGGERWPQLRWPFPFRDTWRPPGKGKW